MRSYYWIKTDRQPAIADLSFYMEGYWVINHINVPLRHRGHGLGRALLTQITMDADFEEADLVLDVIPSGGLNYFQLTDWYSRYGFEQTEAGYMRRRPDAARGLFMHYPYDLHYRGQLAELGLRATMAMEEEFSRSSRIRMERA